MSTLSDFAPLAEGFVGSTLWYVIMATLLVALIVGYVMLKRKGG